MLFGRRFTKFYSLDGLYNFQLINSVYNKIKYFEGSYFNDKSTIRSETIHRRPVRVNRFKSTKQILDKKIWLRISFIKKSEESEESLRSNVPFLSVGLDWMLMS